MFVRESNEYRRVRFIIQTQVSLQEAATCHHVDKTQLQKENSFKCKNADTEAEAECPMRNSNNNAFWVLRFVFFRRHT